MLTHPHAFVCVPVCTCALSVSMQVPVHMYTCAGGGKKSTTVVILQVMPILVFETESLVEPVGHQFK